MEKFKTSLHLHTLIDYVDIIEDDKDELITYLFGDKVNYERKPLEEITFEKGKMYNIYFKYGIKQKSVREEELIEILKEYTIQHLIEKFDGKRVKIEKTFPFHLEEGIREDNMCIIFIDNKQIVLYDDYITLRGLTKLISEVE